MREHACHGAAVSGPFDVVDAARRMMTARQRRARFLPREILGEPAWDILLDLFVSRAEGRDVPLKSACIASGVPATTAMRCLATLRDRGLVDHRPDPVDRRRTLLLLTDLGESGVGAAVRDSFLFAIRDAQSPPADGPPVEPASLL